MTPADYAAAIAKALECVLEDEWCWREDGENEFGTPCFEIDAADGSLSELATAYSERHAEFIAACHPAALRSLLDEREALRRDAERLDFIEKNARCDPKMDGNHVWWPTSFNKALRGHTLRAAIDAALKDTK